MLFWTLVFITFYLINLSKGSILYNSTIKLGELTLEYNKEGISNIKKKEIGKEMLFMLIPVFLVILLLIIQTIFLICAIHIDYLKYPTIIILAFIILNIVKSVKKPTTKINLSTEEYRKKLYLTKKRTFKGTLITLMYLAYYFYMFYILALR